MSCDDCYSTQRKFTRLLEVVRTVVRGCKFAATRLQRAEREASQDELPEPEKHHCPECAWVLAQRCVSCHKDFQRSLR